MLNRPKTRFAETANDSSSASWHFDQNPTFRLVWLCILVALPLVVVGGRLVYIQCYVADSFATATEQTITILESIPSQNGRILASDKRVLVEDTQQFHLQMHFRWIEQPPNRRWLLKQVYSRLNRSERRDRERVEAETQRFLDERRESWQQVARLTGISDEEFERQRQRVQTRVERIVNNVERRRKQRRGDDLKQKPNSDEQSQLDQAWNTVVSELTTPPDRSSKDPIVVTEQLDFHTVIQNVPLEVAVSVVAVPNLFPRVRYVETSHRTYPSGSIAPHIIGTRTAIADTELAKRGAQFPDGDPLDYAIGDQVGKTGVERSYDQSIRGLRGQRKIVKNRNGEIIQTEIVRAPRKGHDVTLTIDFDLQSQSEKLLDNEIQVKDADSDNRSQSERTGGTIVVMNVHNGEIVAAAAAPRFDLNLLVNPEPAEWQRVNSDPRRPFFSRATAMTIPPGSVFKTMTAIAMLQSGLDPGYELHCQGYLDEPTRYRCYKYRHYGVGHGDVPLDQAFCQSCNVYFFSMARSMYRRSRKNGEPEQISTWARRFGFGGITGIDLPGEQTGNLPNPNPKSKSQTAMLSETMGLAIGQARLTVTPLQIARLMAAVSNGGYLVTPHVVREIESIEMEVSNVRIASDRDTPSTHRRRIDGLNADTLQHVRDGLEKVVAHPRGTGYKRVRMKQVTIAGKTGTAEVGGARNDHAWFAGYVPADTPKFAFVVVLEHAGSGGREAGPVAKQLIQSMLDLDLLHEKPKSHAPLAN